MPPTAAESTAPAPGEPITSDQRAPGQRRLLLLLAAVLVALAAITEQVVTMGPLVSADYAVHGARIDLRFPQFYDVMFYLVMIGQRGPAALVALLIAGALSRRRDTRRPLLLLGFALLTLNAVVGAAKLSIARALPADNTAAVFVHNGIIYPSGHAADVVLTWGIAAYMLISYGPLKRRTGGIVVTTIASLIVGAASIYLDTHWLTDILSGWLTGLAVLLVTVWLDRRLADRTAMPGRHRRSGGTGDAADRAAKPPLVGANSNPG